MNTVFGTKRNEAILINIGYGESHLIYVPCSDSWFKLPEGYVQGKKIIFEMCLGPNRNFYLIGENRPGTTLSFILNDGIGDTEINLGFGKCSIPAELDGACLVDSVTGNICKLKENLPNVEEELLARKINLINHHNVVALDGKLFCIVKSLMIGHDGVKFLVLYMLVYEFETLSWKFMEKIFSTKHEECTYIVKAEDKVAYICVQNENEIIMFRFKTSEERHTIEKLATFTYTGSQSIDLSSGNIITNDKRKCRINAIGFEHLFNECNQRELWYNKCERRWIDIAEPRSYNISWGFLGWSRKSPNIGYFLDKYKGSSIVRLFMGRSAVS